MRSFRLLAGVAVVVIATSAGDRPAAITIDYPEEGSIFPPEITPPTFWWHDAGKSAAWSIDISFADGSAAIHTTSQEAPPRIGAIDPNCVADTNQPPRLTAEQASAHTWVPSATLWDQIKRHSVTGPATVTVTGSDATSERASVRIRTSRDPVGAPIFYRDVPLMPSESERGVIKPLAASAVPLVAWRLRDVSRPASRAVMENMPVCANCHSFSADGKTMGMDLDGLQNNRGLYILTQVKQEMSLDSGDLVQWRTAKGALKGSVRVGFMSRVSPDGRFVATTINPLQAAGERDAPSNYYVANFKDYRFLQVFYPTRGILSWYSRESGILQPLPGADDPRYVQMGGVWSPDGGYLVFARADARDPSPPGVPLAQFANDPNELPVRYDLYRIPFRQGKGGRPEAIAGASGDGMSNSFPKVSPDGRWIVFVKARNGLLMRPDSQLYIVPAQGGVARRMRCNTRLMNSWHSFSPNGRWLVFSSKARSPYTQMYLTHIDEDGNDSPAILVDNTTAANRAVNLPEFVNIAPDGLRKIGGPALDYFRSVDNAMYFQKQGRLEESIAMWRQALEQKPDDALAHGNLGKALMMTGHREEAGLHLRRAAELRLRAAVADRPTDAAAYHELGRLLLDQGWLPEAAANLRRAAALDPAAAGAHCDLARALLAMGRNDDALAELRTALRLDPRSAAGYYSLGVALERKGETGEAIRQWQKALEIDSHNEDAHDRLAGAMLARGDFAAALAHWRQGTNSPEALRRMAWLLATCPDPWIRDGREAVALAARALETSGVKDAKLWDTLAAAYAADNEFDDAVLTEERALASARQQKQADVIPGMESRMRLYQSRTAFREPAEDVQR